MTAMDAVWKTLGRQLRHPYGFQAALVGRAMAIVNREPNRIAIDALQIEPTDVVLELGFGPGRAIAELASLAYAGLVLGIDQSAAMIRQARRFNARKIRDGRIDLRQGRLDALPFESNVINKILAVNVLYFFSKDGPEIREMRRVLCSGGKIALYATARSSMKDWKMCTAETHQMYDEDDLLQFLRKGGLVTMNLE